MKKFILYNNRVEIVNIYGQNLTIYFNQNSGKVYYRHKIGSLSKIKHPGIFLGVDVEGISYFLHNHYHIGKAHITTEFEFRQGMPIYIYSDKCSNEPLKVIEIGLNEILRGESYKPVNYNCQTYTNTACHNSRVSEDSNKWMSRVLFGSLMVITVGTLFSRGK
jgi:hypothetical protein